MCFVSQIRLLHDFVSLENYFTRQNLCNFSDETMPLKETYNINNNLVVTQLKKIEYTETL